MEGAEDSMDEIDLIARKNVVPDFVSLVEMNPSIIPPPYTDKDKQFLGFRGLNVVYRVCRPDEYIENGIMHKPCTPLQLQRNIAQHVASGSTNPSRYISTTASRKVASLWALYEMEENREPRKTPLRIVMIPLEPLKGTIVEAGCANLTDVTVREHFVKGATHRSWAKSSQEVIFTNCIPRFRSCYIPPTFYKIFYPWEWEYYSISVRTNMPYEYVCVYWLITPTTPEQPPPKKERKQNQLNLPEQLNADFANISI